MRGRVDVVFHHISGFAEQRILDIPVRGKARSNIEAHSLSASKKLQVSEIKTLATRTHRTRSTCPLALAYALPRTGMSEILCCNALGWHAGSHLAVGVNRSF